MGGALVGILYSRLLYLLMETKVLVKIIWSWRCVYSTIRGSKMEKVTGRKRVDKRREEERR